MTVSTVYYFSVIFCNFCNFHDAAPEASVVPFSTSSRSQILAEQVYDWILNFTTAVLQLSTDQQMPFQVLNHTAGNHATGNFNATTTQIQINLSEKYHPRAWGLAMQISPGEASNPITVNTCN